MRLGTGLTLIDAAVEVDPDHAATSPSIPEGA
jgi:hypothetical protein